MELNQTRELLRTLEQELQSLTARLHGRDAATPEPGSLGLAEGDRGKDLFDQVQASESRESHFASRDRILEKMLRVSAAIKRVKNGGYGECTECGQPIPPARLRAIPEVTTCVACQERLERTGAWKEMQAAARAADLALDEHADAPRARMDVRSAQSTTDILESLRESAVADGGAPAAPGERTAPGRGNGHGGHGRAAAAESRARRTAARATRSRPAGREMVAR